MENYKMVLDQMKAKRDSLMKEMAGLNKAIDALSGIEEKPESASRGHRPNGSITIEKAALHFMEVQSRPVTVNEVFDGVRMLDAVCQKVSIPTTMSKLAKRDQIIRVGDGMYLIKNSSANHANNGHPVAA